MPITQAQRRARSTAGARAAALNRSPDDPQLARAFDEARHAYRYLAAERYVQQLADALTADERARLAGLLRHPVQASGDAA